MTYPSFDIQVPDLLSFLATGSFKDEVEAQPDPGGVRAALRSGQPLPARSPPVLGHRVMAYLGTLMFLVAALGAFLYRRGKLESARWFHRVAILTIAFPFFAMTAGWVLTEMGRQPWSSKGC